MFTPLLAIPETRACAAVGGAVAPVEEAANKA